MSDLFGGMFASVGDEFEQGGDGSERNYYQSFSSSTSADQLKRQASDFVGLKNQ